MNRRRFLVSLGGVLTAGVGAMTPRAVSAATLDASIRILDYRQDGDEHVDAVEFSLSNDRNPGVSDRETAIQPVVIPWSRGSQAQQDWPIVQGPEWLPAGETACYRVETTHTRLRLGEPAILTVYDEGTEQRTWTQFATEATDVE